MTARELLRWQRTHAWRQARGRAWWTSRTALALATAAALAALVSWRSGISVSSASHTWLAGTVAIFALAFIRVPAHLYWRADAALLGQLPIGGGALFDVAVVRCIAAAATATGAVVAGAIPLLALDESRVGAATRLLQAVPIAGDPVPRLTPLTFFLRHVAVAGTLGIAAAALIPAVAMWAASLVATERGGGILRAATAIAGGNSASGDREAPPSSPPSSGAAVLGAVPGAASSAVIVVIILAAPWLQNHDAAVSIALSFSALVAFSIAGVLAMRSSAPRVMPLILRDVSSLDRQQLATLELHPPTALERGIASLLGDAAVSYRKDARLVRRRYPMAFALGAVIFVAFGIIGLARPGDAAPWLIATFIGAAIYGAVLASRLWRVPIELPHLAATLPIAGGARARAKLTWLAVWVLLFVALPAAFAIFRLP